MTRRTIAAWLLAVAIPVGAQERADPVRLDHARSKPGLLVSQGNSLQQVAFNHSGDRLAVGGYYDSVRIWNPRDWSLATSSHATGSISDLCFSPDDRFLYVAAGSVRVAWIARFDARTGKPDQSYVGLKGAAKWVIVSPDGKTVVTRGTFEVRTIFWDADSGRILRSVVHEFLHATVSPDGRGLVCFDPEKGWMLEPFRGNGPEPFPLPGVPRPASQARVTFSPDFRWVVTGNESADVPFYANAGSLALYEKRGGFYAEVARVRDESPWPFRRLALSPNGRTVAAGGLRNNIRFYSLPGLVRVADVDHPRDHGSDYSLYTLEFSPDSSLLALGMSAPVPGLVRVDGFERLQPWAGHGDKVTGLFFTKDGKRLRSIARDHMLCIWDAESMERLARHALPAGYEVAAVRPPFGDRILCHREDSPDTVVVDGTSGEVLFRMKFPARYRTDDVRWLPGNRLLLVDDDRKGLGWFDCAKNKLVREIAFEKPTRIGVLTEDFRSLYAPERSYRNEVTVRAVRIDLESGEAERIEPQEPIAIRARIVALVPGGRYFCLADPDVRIFERDSLRCVAHRRIDAKSLTDLAFSGDGERYAATESSETRLVTRIYETLSGKLICEVPHASSWGIARLDAAGARLAIVNADATIERWTLPPPAK